MIPFPWRRTGRWRCRLGSILLGCLAVPAAMAGLEIEATRFIYPAQEKSVLIRVRNTGQHPILVQTWLDHGEPGQDLSELRLPFILLPPLLRLEPAEKKALQLRHTGEALPKDRESVFWINFLHLPAGQTDDAVLRIALTSVMKVLYRPAGLPGDPKLAPAQIRWRVLPGSGPKGLAPFLEAQNPTPYTVSLTTVTLSATHKPVVLKNLNILPFSTSRFELPAITAAPRANGTRLTYEAVDDFGLPAPGSATLGLIPEGL
ncbi:molecular chaperone [Achromobacter seleniivolatilans]|uniref:Molecular chaperone n=1 Tax=Achromobacter seleniivolatilans TaxID=3047478 RepID=A0ABY9LWC8_9BURK|nr:molecular chaperone [Achromobacter sp. R39]WMD19072.1 molecular chaperone [Achromobacter sp. R39]